VFSALPGPLTTTSGSRRSPHHGYRQSTTSTLAITTENPRPRNRPTQPTERLRSWATDRLVPEWQELENNHGVSSRLGTVRALPWGSATWTAPAISFSTTRPGLQGFRRIFDAASSQHHVLATRNVAILRILWSLGLRRAELCELDLEHFDTQGKRISIFGKGRRERKWLELPAQTLKAIDAWVEIRGDRPGPLFTNLDRRTKRARLSGAGLYQIVKRLGQSVGIETRVHAIRHATITQRIASGMPLPEVQDSSRHSNVATLMLYNDRLNDAAGRLSAVADAEI
jgi:integrase/recombinase XerC